MIIDQTTLIEVSQSLTNDEIHSLPVLQTPMIDCTRCAIHAYLVEGKKTHEARTKADHKLIEKVTSTQGNDKHLVRVPERQRVLGKYSEAALNCPMLVNGTRVHVMKTMVGAHRKTDTNVPPEMLEAARVTAPSASSSRSHNS